MEPDAVVSSKVNTCAIQGWLAELVAPAFGVPAEVTMRSKNAALVSVLVEPLVVLVCATIEKLFVGDEKVFALVLLLVIAPTHSSLAELVVSVAPLAGLVLVAAAVTCLSTRMFTPLYSTATAEIGWLAGVATVIVAEAIVENTLPTAKSCVFVLVLT